MHSKNWQAEQGRAKETPLIIPDQCFSMDSNRTSMTAQDVLLLVVLLVGVNAAVANNPPTDSRARATSIASLCAAIGTAYVTPPSSPQPTCRLHVQHQGTKRFADVYFPPSYSASSDAPLWLHLHGLYRVAGLTPPVASLRQPRQQLQQQQQLDHIKRAAEHIADTWGSVKGWLGKEAVLVYPDASGALPGFQMWNSGFWQCPYKSDPEQCVNGEVDDVGFLELLTQTLLNRLPAQPTEVYAMGFSNGGMVLTTLLCKSEYMRSILTAATLAGTVLRKGYLETACSPGQQQQSEADDNERKPGQESATRARRQAASASNALVSGAAPQQQELTKVPLLFIHGMVDTLFPFYEGSTSATGDVLLSTIEMVDAWAARYSCQGSAGSPPLVYLAGEGVACRDFCHRPSAADGDAADSAEEQQSVIWLCAMEGQKHNWSPFMADLAWTFYQERQQHTAALPQPEFPVWQVAGPRTTPAAAPQLSPMPAQPNSSTPLKQQQQQQHAPADADAAAKPAAGKVTAAHKPSASPAAAAVPTSKSTIAVASPAAAATHSSRGKDKKPAAVGNTRNPSAGHSSTALATAPAEGNSSSSSNSSQSESVKGATPTNSTASAGKAASGATEAAAAASRPSKGDTTKRVAAAQGAGQAATTLVEHNSRPQGKPAGSQKQ